MNYVVPSKVLESACFTIHLDVSQRSYIIVFVPARTFSSQGLASDVISKWGKFTMFSCHLSTPDITRSLRYVSHDNPFFSYKMESLLTIFLHQQYSRVFLQSLTINTLTNLHIHLESLIPSQRLSMLIYETG
ncbi:hypothetical protein M422DRAFT_56299 [Sphaerobolus stellatus SS14]|uniref:Unplaced genomic scaffold SPHSTscaffold_390, whole genome shotgun sequence n=1 Tax=Sphaerobolus stellatus (strain SS14) TaxID=990650 RepID=A0A0C9TS34_SPHS4|nr:hypothetical protein M422DRAFT_56299 [Sphaerobolus stellatus SS14]